MNNAPKFAAVLLGTRVGTVVVFKAGITHFEAEDALKKIADVLDEPHCSEISEFEPPGWPVFYIP